ncbi:alpha/beta fold hydrolase [Arthrobacter sp. H14]|uniref:alpha/beta fold hydrolase n=1 Tax=Arthrobacter sp. H14 TaxID=1312959 RepID=UPI0012DF0479|nr:alpha/beta hydrolase [Arthrobacter sp. H14]
MDPTVRKPNPDALPGAEEPRAGYYAVNGTMIYAEVRGSGPAVLLVSSVYEDAEIYRGVAERLTGFTVVTYDNRGTSRSGRENWPGCGSGQHADDAAGLIEALGLEDVVVFGSGTGGIIALQFALRYPELVKSVLVYEPGYFSLTEDGRRLQDVASRTIDHYLTAFPDDWVGALAALGRATAGVKEGTSRGFFEPPTGKEWYGERRDLNAEAFVKNDIQLGFETPDEAALAALDVDVRVVCGTSAVPVFRDIAARLAAIRGTVLDFIPRTHHHLYFRADATAAYIQERASAPSQGRPQSQADGS